MKLVLGDYMKIAIRGDGFFWCVILRHLQSFLQTVGLEEQEGESIHSGGNKQNERRGNIFGKMGNKKGYTSGR